MTGSAWAPQTAQLVNGNVQNDGTADSPRGWAVADNAAYNFTSSGPSRVRCSGLTAQRTVTLPTTGIKAGAEFEVLVTGATETNYLLINSSGGNEVERIGGEGKVTVVALQDAPTTAAHWQVKDVWESQTPAQNLSASTNATFSGGASFSNAGYYLTRNNKIISLLTATIRTTNANNSGTLSLLTINTRHRPVSTVNSPIRFQEAGASQAASGMMTIDTAGIILCYTSLAGGTWTASASGTGNGINNASLTWQK